MKWKNWFRVLFLWNVPNETKGEPFWNKTSKSENKSGTNSIGRFTFSLSLTYSAPSKSLFMFPDCLIQSVKIVLEDQTRKLGALHFVVISVATCVKSVDQNGSVKQTASSETRHWHLLQLIMFFFPQNHQGPNTDLWFLVTMGDHECVHVASLKTMASVSNTWEIMNSSLFFVKVHEWGFTSRCGCS